MASRRLLAPDDTAPAPQAAADGTGGADDVVQWHLNGAAVKVAVAGNVLVAAVFFAAIIWRVFFTGTVSASGGQEGAAVSPSPEAHGRPSSAQYGAAAEAEAGALLLSSSSASSTRTPPRSGGLGKADLLALPVYVVHGSSGEVGGGAEEAAAAAECAVCLGELRDGETGRVLPRCGHRFHAECVDRWFRSHVTCPLCRAVVAADDGGSGKPPKVQLDV